MDSYKEVVVQDPDPPDLVPMVENGMLEGEDDGAGDEQERQLENLTETTTKERQTK